MTTKTIDERIRTGAREELKKRIEDAARPMRTLLQIGYNLDVTIHTKDNTVTAHAHGLIDRIVAAMFEDRVVGAEEKAVADFLLKVNSLQAQVDELRQEAA